jgi:hypothetical protein
MMLVLIGYDVQYSEEIFCFEHLSYSLLLGLIILRLMPQSFFHYGINVHALPPYNEVEGAITL